MGAIALVTGATRGIGRSIAVHMAKQGYDIAFCYKSSEEAAKSLSQEIEVIGQKSFYMRSNVSEFEEAKLFVKSSIEVLGVPDVVINNAGITMDAPLVLMKEQEWQNVIQNNLSSVYNVSREVVFHFMKRKKGGIINISSVSGVYGNPTQANYSASKAGIIGFSKALAKEVGKYQIRVNVVAPGFIQTDMTHEIALSRSEEIMKSIPLGRAGDVSDVAELVGFLASEKANYITGQTIQVDGGIIL